MVGTPLCEDRYCSLDPTLRGRTEREMFTLGYRSDDWRVTAYAQHYDWDLLSNFTYFLDDPVNGDQLRQYDKLWTYGGRLERTVQLGDALSIRAGAEGRVDDIGRVGFDETIEGVKEFTVGAFDASESSLGLYAEAIWRPIERMMVIGGLRNDWYRFRIRPLEGEAAWGGTVKDDTFAPKLGVNYELADGIALYANFGEGFHSNDARGVTNPDSPAPGLVEGDFEEMGARFERGGAILTAGYWWSSIESELIYVGDSGAVEPSDPGKRHGYELTGFWKPKGWLAIDVVLTGSQARYVGLLEGQNFVPGALESSGELGLSAIFPEYNASLRMRYLGPHPLIEDNSVRGASTLLFNGRLAWMPSRFAGLSVYAELLNILDSRDDDNRLLLCNALPRRAAGRRGGTQQPDR